jgi:quercetin dioxygenase-like cupin family protein
VSGQDKTRADELRLRRETDACRWEHTELLAYKDAGSAPFKAISRQVLFDDPALQCQLRYFEMAPGGYSTLERHEHAHAVMILRGEGRCLVGDRIKVCKPHDLILIPSMTWHQFRASDTESFGFLCMVNNERDRPQLPSEADVAALRGDAQIAAFISV